MDEKKLMDTIKAVTVPERYTMRVSETTAIYNLASGEWFRAITYAFRYGFLKGQRAEKAKIKKQKEARSA